MSSEEKKEEQKIEEQKIEEQKVEEKKVEEEKTENLKNEENKESEKKEESINKEEKKEEEVKKVEEKKEIKKVEEKKEGSQNEEVIKKVEDKKEEPLPEHLQKDIDKFSFCSVPTLIETKTLKAPYPIRLTIEQLTTTFKDFMKDYEVRDGGVYCLNQEIVSKQYGIIKEVVVQLSKCIWSGSAMSLSLPIRIFEPRSMLERISDWFALAPTFIQKACECTDRVESFKNVIAFSLGCLFKSSQQLKPLNPMLGETYQCEWKDGTKMYFEHTCHTPPVSHFYLLGKDNAYTISGYYDMGMGGIVKTIFNNTMLLIPKGKATVHIKATGQTICFQLPKVTLGGALWGQRYVYFSGHMKFEDRQNNLKAMICFAKGRKELKSKRMHDIYGKLFHYDFAKHDPNPKKFYEESLPSSPFPSKAEDVICEITGSWLEELKFNNAVFFNIKDNIPPQIYPSKECIKSDCRYREDKEWLQLSWDNPSKGKLYESYAQCWKLALEAQQRFERGLRKKYSEKK